METTTCPYCGKPAERVGGDRIYPHRPDLAGKNFYLCAPCDAYVGCHPGSNKALGVPANKELRRLRNAAHASFDPLWKSKRMTRSNAYKWLASSLSIPVEECHIGRFGPDLCLRTVEVIHKAEEL